MRHLQRDAEYTGDREEKMAMTTRRMKAMARLGAMVLPVTMLFTVTSASAANPPKGQPQFTVSYVLFTPGDSPFGQFDEASGMQGVSQQSGKLAIIAKQPSSPKSPLITLTRGTSLDGGRALERWHEMALRGELEKARKTVSLAVVDRSGGTVLTYTLHNAWPSRIEWTGSERQTYFNVTLQAESITQSSPRPCAAKVCGNFPA